jgi:hypothetical protein
VRLLLNLIEGLPRNTLTQEAMSQDDELVELILSTRDREEVSTSGMRWREFSPEVEMAYAVVDRLGDVITATVSTASKKPPRIPALKRPETAWQRVEKRLDRERHDALVRRVLPNG